MQLNASHHGSADDTADAAVDSAVDRADEVAAVVSRFLDAARTATISDCDLWAPDAVHDVTVPEWRYRRIGPDAIRETYGRWFSEPGTFVELTRDAFAGGEVVRYLISSTEAGEPYVAHHLHRLEVSGGLISSDVVFCAGRWSPARQAEMAAAERDAGVAGRV